jgi:hypothetical protein
MSAALANEDDVHTMPARHVAVNALDALYSARCIGIAKDERRALHGDAVDEQPERNVHHLIASSA